MKKTISATVDIKLAKWIEKEIGGRYRNRSHLVEEALVEMKKKLEKRR